MFCGIDSSRVTLGIVLSFLTNSWPSFNANSFRLFLLKNIFILRILSFSMTVKQRVPMEEYSTTLTPPMEHPLTEAPNPHIVKTDDENNHPPVEEESAENEMTTSCKQTTTEKCKQQQQLADVVNLVVSNEPKTENNMTKMEEKPEETGDETNEKDTKEMVESTNNETKNVVNNENREINKPKPTKQPSSGKIIEINFRYSDITTKSVFS